MKPEEKRIVAELSRLQANRCLEPEETCEQKGIQAHSIPNSAVLSLLCEDGHVITPVPRMQFEQLISVEFKRVGRNQATTFTGLCADHDRELFRDVEIRAFSPGDPWHRFLVTYRAAIRQLHSDIGAAMRMQAAFLKKVEMGKIPGTEPTVDGIEALKFLIWAYDTYKLKRELDGAYLRKDPSILSSRCESMLRLEPTVAVSSLITAEVPGEQVMETPPLFLSVLPTPDTAHVVLGSLREHAPAHRSLTEHLLNCERQQQLTRLSRVILKNCENFVLSPRFFRSLDDEERSAIEEYFTETISDLTAAGRRVPCLFRDKAARPCA